MTEQTPAEWAVYAAQELTTGGPGWATRTENDMPITRREPPAAAQAREPGLVGGAVYRTARKPWTCACPGNGHQNCPHLDCAQTIAPGDRHVEYVAEAEPYRSGTRYCMPCGVATWRDHVARGAGRGVGSRDVR